MNFHELGKPITKLIADNSPAILTALGVAGSVAATVLTAKATFKAAEILIEEEDRRFRSSEVNKTDPGLSTYPDSPLTRNEKVKAVWKLYIPPVSVLAVTCGAIVMSNRISTKRAAALATAYTVLQKNHEEYADKVKETLGINKEEKVRAEIAQKHIDENPPDYGQITVGSGEVWFLDGWTGRYFKSDMASVKEAIVNVNHRIVKGDYASLNELYSFLGLSSVPSGEEFGFNSDRLIDPHFTTGTTDDGRVPVHVLNFRTEPIRGYRSVH